MLLPHPYLFLIRDYFKAQTNTWNFFAAKGARESEWADFKNSLLKNAYRMNPDSESDLYNRLEMVKQKLDIKIPVTLYQLQNSIETNAFIAYHENEASVVFSGPILKLLQNAELDALLAHELSHLKLYTIEHGDFQVTSSMVTAIANDARSEDVFLETARYFRLYMEIYCDRGSLLATDEETAQSALIKIHTGLDKVSTGNYLQQAKEILAAQKDIKSEHDTHPENFIRILAVRLYATQPEKADAQIAELIELHFDMDKLDVFRQQKLADYTHFLLHKFTEPKWIQTNAVLSVCRQYFSNFENHKTAEVDWKPEVFKPNVLDYFSYVLMDVAFADPQLENVPLGRALQFSEKYGLKDAFCNVLKKEKKLSDKRLRELQGKAVEAVSKIEV